MNRLMRFAAGLLVAGLAPAAWAQGWTELAGSATGTGLSSPAIVATVPMVDVGADGLPVVAWQQKSGTYANYYLKKWNGSAWVELGGSATGGGISTGTTGLQTAQALRWMAVDSAGNPSVVWLGKSSPAASESRVYFKRWNGTQWIELAGSGSGTGLNPLSWAWAPTLAIDPTGRPAVAWTVSQDLLGGGGDLVLKQWNGTAWTGVGNSDIAGTATVGVKTGYAYSIAADAQGKPSVAFCLNIIGAVGPFFRRWSGSAWEDLAGSGTGTGIGGIPNLGGLCVRLEAGGAPVVAWSAYPAGFASQVFLKRWSGSAWQEFAGSGSGLGISQNGGGSGSFSRNPALALDAQSRPMLAWEQKDLGLGTGTGLHFRYWDGGAWLEMDGSASGGGIGASAVENVTNPSLARDASGTVLLAWRTTDPAQTAESKIHLKTHVAPLPSMQALGQFRLDGITPIAPGGLTQGETGFVAQALLQSADGGTVHLEVEAQQVGLPFPGGFSAQSNPVAGGSPVSVTVSGLSAGQRMHWRARVVSTSGLSGPWQHFGSSDDGETDFWVRSNAAPAIASAQQVDPGTGQVLAPGAKVFGTGTITILASSSDSDSDDRRIEVELRADGDPFTGTPTAAGPFTTGAALQSIEVPYSGSGAFRWKTRAVDSFGLATPWMSPNGGSGPDFVTVIFGSIGASGCLASAAGSSGALLLLAAAISVLAGRGACGPR